MLWAFLIIILSVVFGTLLALVPKGHASWMGPMRTFALTAALSVVVLHLLPEALAGVGAVAIVIFLLGLFTPELLGKLGAFLWRAGREGDRGGNARDLALEASYFGLLLHRVGDGIGLGAFTGEMHALSGSGGVLTALAAHAVPVVAIVVLTFDSVRGRSAALGRAGGLAVASMVGVFLAQSVPVEMISAASGWVAAFVGGTLLHVVTHDLSLQLPQTGKQKSADLLAGALGLVVSLIGRGAHDEHGHEGEHAMGHFEHALTEFAIETGPLLILGLVVGAVLTTLGTKIPASFFRSRGAAMDAARGTLIGAPLPLCSCSVLPISSALKKRGAAPALIVAFLISTPELGVETFALSVRFLGWEFALIRLATALLVAFGAALVVASVLRRRGQTEAVLDEGLALPQTTGSWPRRVLVAFDELFHHVGAWMILGIVAAALVDVALPPEAFAQISGWPAQFLVVTLIAVPSYVCAPSATPLAAVLLAKGLSPGAMLVGLLLGPATNIATVVFLSRWFGRFAAFAGVLAVVVLAWLFGLLVDHFWTFQLPVDAVAEGHEHGAVWMAMATVSGLLLMRAFFRTGVRGFLSTLQGEHGHAHADDEPEEPGGHAQGGHAHGGHGHGGHGHSHD